MRCVQKGSCCGMLACQLCRHVFWCMQRALSISSRCARVFVPCFCALHGIQALALRMQMLSSATSAAAACCLLVGSE